MQIETENSQEVRASQRLQVILSVVSLVYFAYNAVMTAPWTLASRLKELPIESAWRFFGLEQNWKLFSPEIRKINYHTVGVITYKNGFKEIWEIPRQNKLDLFERIKKDKFRKWSVDSLPWKAHKGYWPGLARFIGKSRFRADNPPTQFSLILLWQDTPEPGQMIARNSMPVQSNPSHIFTYIYSAEDFQTP